MTVPNEVAVWLGQPGGVPIEVGTLRASFQGGRALAATSFQYDSAYLSRPDCYELSPDLPLLSGRQYTPDHRALFGAFADAAPDEWGRKIIQANHANRLAADPALPRSLGDFDYLVGVADRTRIGALRLRDPATGIWLSDDEGVANVHDLARILEAAQRYEDDEATDEDVAYLNDIATSPGGARPKANVVMGDGRLAIAKLPRSSDGGFDVERWEALALTIAGRCGIRVPEWELRTAGERKSVLIVYRFDRVGDGGRVGYISAATALEIGHASERYNYEQFSDAIAELSARPADDLAEMYARIALTLLINNVDDHWNNHGFLRADRGWRLAPAFDLNPSRQRGVINSRPVSDRDDPRRRDLRRLLEVASSFRLTDAVARGTVRGVAEQVARWRDVASELGIAAGEQDGMAVAFDEEQRAYAESL